MSLRFLIIVLLLATACTDSPKGGAHASDSRILQTEKDYFPDKVRVEHAKNFSVSYHGNYKVVRAKIGFATGPTNPSGQLEYLITF